MTSRPTPFQTSLRDASGVTTVVVVGDFEGATVDSFEAVTDTLEISLSPLVVLDLAGVELIDSAAIGAIMRFRQRFADHPTELQINAPRPYQQRLFEITGLSHILSDQ